jgi:hypothetical protein
VRWGKESGKGDSQCSYKPFIRQHVEIWKLLGRHAKDLQPGSETTSITEEVGQGTFPAIELIRLLPQRICFELPERRLDSGASSRVRGDSCHCERGAAEQAQLAAEEEPPTSKEEVRYNVAERCWLEQRRYVWDWF